MTTTDTDYRLHIRHALAMAAGDYQPKDCPLTSRFIERAVELIAGREPERLDPATQAARSGAEFQMYLRALLDEDAFAGILPELATVLRAAQVDIPERPAPREQVDSPPLPWGA